MCSAQTMSGPDPVFAATAAFGWMSSCHSLFTVTSTPVTFVKAAMFSRVARSSASRNFAQRRKVSFAPGSGLKGCSCAQASVQSSRLGDRIPAPVTAAPLSNVRLVTI